MGQAHGRPSPVLTFLGAAGTVTGSRFMVEFDERRVLVDAGLYQGLPDLRRRNWEPMPVSPRTIQAAALTHAHLDHCGYLPRRVRDGFTGPIRCTHDTAALAEIVLRDSAHLQEEDARYSNEGGWSRHHPALPLYDTGDAERVALFQPVAFSERSLLAEEVSATFRAAGHILGSSVVTLDVGDRRVVFSGDLSREGHPLLKAPEPPPAADALVIESTYGARRHPEPDPDVLAEAIRRTVDRGGSVLVPAFAVDRTELDLLELRRLTDAGEIPRLPIFVDSPMALKTLDVYRRALHGASPQLRPDRLQALAALDHLDLHPVRDAEHSERLNQPKFPCIVVSASGMATGGRVVHHLAHQLPDPRNCIVLTGFQAVGTRGRDLLEGARHVKMHGRYVPVRAEVVQVPTSRCTPTPTS